MVQAINPIPTVSENPMEDNAVLAQRDDNEPVYDIDIGDEKDDDLLVEVINDVPEEDRGRQVGSSPDFNPDDVEELKDISARGQQRFDKMRFEYHSEKRRADEEKRRADEAIRFAQGLQQQNQNLRGQQTQMTDTLSQSMQDTRQTAVNAAKARYQKAHEDGDGGAMADANAEMAQAAAELAAIKANTPAPQPQQEPQQPQQPQPQYQQPQQPQPQYQQPQNQLSETQQKWLENNKSWFNQEGHEAATGYAFELDKQLRGAGIDPKTDAFYNTIVTRVRERYPNSVPKHQGQNSMTANETTRTAPVASAGNQDGGLERPRANKVRLTASQVSLAKRLGLTPKEYAKELRKMEGT